MFRWGTKKGKPTTRIRFLQSIAGTRNAINPETGEETSAGTWHLPAGAVVNWDAEEAERLVDRGVAVPATNEPVDPTGTRGGAVPLEGIHNA